MSGTAYIEGEPLPCEPSARVTFLFSGGVKIVGSAWGDDSTQSLPMLFKAPRLCEFGSKYRKREQWGISCIGGPREGHAAPNPQFHHSRNRLISLPFFTDWSFLNSRPVVSWLIPRSLGTAEVLTKSRDRALGSRRVQHFFSIQVSNVYTYVKLSRLEPIAGIVAACCDVAICDCLADGIL